MFGYDISKNNKGKLEEIRKILSDYKIYSLKEKNIDIDVIEDKESFLGNAENEDRSAQVICTLVYYDGTNKIIGEGVLDGFISRICRGENGFGFDEIFELPNGSTLAELSSEEKNEISARALALKDLKKKLSNMI